MAENAIGEEGAKEREGAKLGIPNAGEGADDAAREGDEDPANGKALGWANTDAGAGAKLGIPNAGEDAAKEETGKEPKVEEPANEKELGWALTDAPKPLEPNAIMELAQRPAALKELETTFKLDCTEAEETKGSGTAKDVLMPNGTKSAAETNRENTFDAETNGAEDKRTVELDD